MSGGEEGGRVCRCVQEDTHASWNSYATSYFAQTPRDLRSTRPHTIRSAVTRQAVTSRALPRLT